MYNVYIGYQSVHSSVPSVRYVDVYAKVYVRVEKVYIRVYQVYVSVQCVR